MSRALTASLSVAMAFSIMGCVRPSDPPEPSWAGPDSLLGTWTDAHISTWSLPGDLSFVAPDSFSFRVTGIDFRPGPNSDAREPYEVTVTGTFRVRGRQLLLTPERRTGPPGFADAEVRLIVLDHLGAPVPYTFEVVGRQLFLRGPGRVSLVFIRRQAPPHAGA